jgi:ribosome biogenesis GTPase A
MEEKIEKVSWYPGHIKTAEDQLKSKWLPLLDLVLELIDGRVPISGRYPDDKIWGNKLVLPLYTKKDLTDTNIFPKDSLLVDSRFPHQWKNKLISAIKKAAQPVFKKLESQGRKRKLRIGICGLPNVGKSTFLNSLGGIGKKAKTGNLPGITKQMQWITSAADFDLLDTPGIIPFSVVQPTAFKLALCSLMPAKLFEQEAMANFLSEYLQENYPVYWAAFKQEEGSHHDADLLIKNFRSGKLGKICLDRFEA